MSFKVNRAAIPKAVLGIFGVILWIIGLLFNFPAMNIISLYVLGISIYLVWWSRKNVLYFIVFAVIAYSNYSITFSEYVVVKENSLFTQYAGTWVAANGIYVMLLFWSVLLLALPGSVPAFSSKRFKDYWRSKKTETINFYYCLVLNAVLLLIWFYGYTRPSALGDRGSPSALYEYSVIFFILCYYFGGKFKSITISTTIILGMFVLQNFVFGGRIAGLQLLILFYVMCMEEKYGIKKIMPIIIPLFLLLNFIGVYRGSWIGQAFRLTKIWEALQKNWFTLDTAYSSYHTSLTFILYGETADVGAKLGMFGNFLKSIIVGGYGTPENSLAHLTSKYYTHYGGGVLPFFFYFFMGWGGVVAIALYVGLFFRKLSKVSSRTSGLRKCVCVFFVASAFRWYLYSPIQITRGVLLVLITFSMSDMALRFFSSRRRGRK